MLAQAVIAEKYEVFYTKGGGSESATSFGVNLCRFNTMYQTFRCTYRQC